MFPDARLLPNRVYFGSVQVLCKQPFNVAMGRKYRGCIDHIKFRVNCHGGSTGKLEWTRIHKYLFNHAVLARIEPNLSKGLGHKDNTGWARLERVTESVNRNCIG